MFDLELLALAYPAMGRAALPSGSTMLRRVYTMGNLDTAILGYEIIAVIRAAVSHQIQGRLDPPGVYRSPADVTCNSAHFVIVPRRLRLILD